MKLFSSMLMIALLSGMCSPTFSQTFKEGKISYAVSVVEGDNIEAVDPKQKASLPTTSDVYYKGKRSRSEMKSSEGTTIEITDYAASKTTVLIDSKGKKMSREIIFSDMNSDKREVREIKSTGEMKMIAGYNCERKILHCYIESADRFMEYEVWVTNQLMLPVTPELSFDGIKGFALEYDVVKDGINLHMKATKVESVPVSDSKFTIPAGYSPMAPPAPVDIPVGEIKILEPVK